jgi:hypothetical protein
MNTVTNEYSKFSIMVDDLWRQDETAAPSFDGAARFVPRNRERIAKRYTLLYLYAKRTAQGSLIHFPLLQSRL